jgi:hypothetical protein
MLRLLKRDISPADEFSYVHFETGYTSKASDWYTWRDNINAHRKSNELPPITMEEAEDQLCRRLGPADCSYASENNPPAPVNTRISMDDVVNGMKVFAAWMVQLFKTVPQEEAERRANICARCYLNVQAEGCGACSQLANILGTFSKSTKMDDRLKVCANCRCVNRAQVFAPLDVLAPHFEPEFQAGYPDFCWQKVGGENFNSETMKPEMVTA